MGTFMTLDQTCICGAQTRATHVSFSWDSWHAGYGSAMVVVFRR